ncbi:hypothetical protein EMCRGX_G024707 [Ephydatia muelleri]
MSSERRSWTQLTPLFATSMKLSHALLYLRHRTPSVTVITRTIFCGSPVQLFRCYLISVIGYKWAVFFLAARFSDGFGVVPAVLGDDNPFNYSNASVGVIFYLVLLALSLSHSPKLLLAACLLSLCSCGFSVYLIYVLVVVLRKVCLVCYATHVINLLLLGLLASRWRVSIREGNKRKAA